MRKTTLAILSLLLTFTLLNSAAPLAPAAAAGSGTSAKKQLAYLDTKVNTTFVPLRFIAEDIGGTVNWTKERTTIVYNGKTVTLIVGQTTVDLNGEPLHLPAPAFVDRGVTYVPLRLVDIAFGLKLEWRSATSSVLLTLPDQSQLVLPAVPREALQAGKPPIVSEQKTFTVNNKKFNVQLVTVSLLDPKVELDVVLAGDKAGKVEALDSLANRKGAAVAINGTYFDAYTDDAFKQPYGYLANNGEVLYRAPGELRTIFTYDRNNLTELIGGGEFNTVLETGRLDGALQAGPRLIKNGKVALDVKNEGFKDPKILTGGGARSALGITKDHRLILLTVGGATIPQLAELMKKAGAYQAMNLDGGASSGLYYNGKYLTKPGRQISNALIVKLSK